MTCADLLDHVIERARRNVAELGLVLPRLVIERAVGGLLHTTLP